jgi:dephospho-CoA kinase
MQSHRKIVAIIGLPGAGKSEAVSHIVDRHGWPKVYFGEVTFDEMARQGLEINENNERLVREILREEFGPLVYAERVIEKIHALEGDGPVLVESLYSWEEYLRFKEEFGKAFVTIAICASPRIRYDRLASRQKRPLMADEAKSRDYAQIENLHQAGPIAMADYMVTNERTMLGLIVAIEEIVRDLR